MLRSAGDAETSLRSPKDFTLPFRRCSARGIAPDSRLGWRTLVSLASLHDRRTMKGENAARHASIRRLAITAGFATAAVNAIWLVAPLIVGSGEPPVITFVATLASIALAFAASVMALGGRTRAARWLLLGTLIASAISWITYGEWVPLINLVPDLQFLFSSQILLSVLPVLTDLIYLLLLAAIVLAFLDDRSRKSTTPDGDSSAM